MTMRTKFHLVVGYGTLVVDVYLALASIATKMMKPQYGGYLPPFSSEGVTEPSRFMVLLVATWTAILAMGYLKANHVKSDGAPAPGTTWFVLVLAMLWLGYLTPVLWNLFVKDL